jgi:hypothetical protein
LFEVCHGCGGGLYTYEEHWRTKLGGRKEYSFFHEACYKHYRRNHAHNVRWAEKKEKAK